jgi:glycerol-3-phosphate acyltransferase PlsY
MLRLAAAAAIAIAGFWYPLWWDFRTREPDSRVGFLLCWSLPVMVAYAIWATAALIRARQTTEIFSHKGRLAFVSVCMIISWLPLAWMAIGAVIAFVMAR